MLGKPLVCIALSSHYRPLSPLTLQRHPLTLPFLNHSALYYLLRQCRQAGLDTVLILLDETLFCQLDSLRQLCAGLPLRIEWLLYTDHQPDWRVRLLELLNQDEPVLLFQNPSLDLLPLQSLLDFHAQEQADCSLRLSRGPMGLSGPGKASHRQAVYLDQQRQVTEKPTDLCGYDTRCYLIEPDIFEALLSQPLNLLRQPLLPPLLEAAEFVSGLLSDKLWADWQTPADFFTTQSLILTKRLLEPAHKRLLKQDKATIWLGEDVLLDKGVRFVGPVVLGDQVTIEAGVTIQGPALIGARTRIQANCLIESSWIWPGCRIEQNAKLKQSWLGEQVQIAGGSQLDGVWAAEHSRLKLTNPLPSGTILGPYSRLEY
jgi:NDP-sugar pyrophosphorylase family protein